MEASAPYPSPNLHLASSVSFFEAHPLLLVYLNEAVTGLPMKPVYFMEAPGLGAGRPAPSDLRLAGLQLYLELPVLEFCSCSELATLPVEHFVEPGGIGS
jgi:hypothetical protein